MYVFTTTDVCDGIETLALFDEFLYNYVHVIIYVTLTRLIDLLQAKSLFLQSHSITCKILSYLEIYKSYFAI